MNKEQQHIIDEAYENYCTTLIGSITFSERGKHFKSDGLEFNSGYPNYVHYTKEEFINKCKTEDALSIKWIEEYGNLKYGSKEEIEHLSKHYKTYPEFSERWGLKIEERELSLEERQDLYFKLNPEFRLMHESMIEHMIKHNIPTKLITVTRELSEDEVWDYIHKNKIEILHQHAVLYGHEVGSEYRKSFIPTLKENYNIPTNETIESYE